MNHHTKSQPTLREEISGAVVLSLLSVPIVIAFEVVRHFFF